MVCSSRPAKLAQEASARGRGGAAYGSGWAEARLAFVEQVSDEWEALTIDVRRKVLGSLSREITVGKEKQPRIVWKDAGELTVDYAIGALPELRVPAIKGLPAPRVKAADLLDTAQGRNKRAVR